MLQSRLFAKPLREAPRDAESLNARLLARAGFVHKNSAGVYTYLNLGLRVMKRVSAIVREEMDALGSEEVLMPALLERRYLEATGRFDAPVGYEAYGKGDDEPAYVLGWTHEEVLSDIASHFVSSHRDLPFSAYQIQTKFRNEARAKSGILRGREFVMKDLYSFHETEEDFRAFYERVAEAYMQVFSRCGVHAVRTLAGGGAFTAGETHEFQALLPCGEDSVLLCAGCGYAENAEVGRASAGGPCPSCKAGGMEERKGVEVGNIFPLGTRYSEAFGLSFADSSGARKPAVMGSYGIGISRLVGVIAEATGSEAGLSWPLSVAPFAVHLLDLTNDGSGRRMYEDLVSRGVETLLDDRKASAGEKFAVADLVGIPFRAVVGERTGGKAEVVRRGTEMAPALMDAAALASAAQR